MSPAVPGALAAFVHHPLARVVDDDAALTFHRLPDPARDVAGAAGHVENGHAGAGREPGHHLPLPQAMDAAAHQVVHEVVAAGDPVEQVADEPRLLVLADAAEAEIGAIRGVVLTARGGHGGDHSPAAKPALPWPQDAGIARGRNRAPRARRAASSAARITHVTVRRGDLRRPLPPDIGQVLTGRAVQQFRAARQVSAGTPRRRPGADRPPWHVGAPLRR